MGILSRKYLCSIIFYDGQRGGDIVRVAICDDDDAFRAGLRRSIDYSETLPTDVEIVEYSGGAELIRGHAERQFDIIFLDIQMDGMTGLEAGQEIRKADKDAIIIFITSHEQHVFKSFKIEVFDYLLKPAEDEEVKEVLIRALKKHSEQHHLISFSWQDTDYILDASEIVYLAGYNRKIKFVTKKLWTNY